MSLSESIINRMRETFGKKATAAPVHVHQSDAMLRTNIPPLMGRRDAACDRVCELLQTDIFAMDELDRIKLYRMIEDLLSGAERDTAAILTLLSSPDTRNRERQMLEFVQTIRISIGALPPLLSGARLLFGEDSEVARFAGLTDNGSLLHDEELISECEISIIHRIRAFVDNGNTRIARYREYTGKSFSQAFAERYRKAWTMHRGVFSRGAQDL